MNLYRESDVVATAVDRITDEVEHIKPVVMDESGILKDSHKVLDLLKCPNEYESWPQFIGKLSRHYLLTHNAYIYAAGSVTLPPNKIHATKPQCVTSQEGEDSYPEAFQINEGAGTGNYEKKIVKRKARYYSGGLKEIYHEMGFSSRSDDSRADSPLLASLKAVSQQIQGMIHNESLLRNGARPSLMLQFKDNISEDEARKRKQFLSDQIAGANNAGEIMSTFASDMDVHEFSISNKDMDYAVLDQVVRNAIYTRYKVPLPLVSMEASTFNNMENAVYHFYDWAVLPLADRMFMALSHMLMPRYGLDPSKVWLTYDPETIDALRGRTIKELLDRKTLNVETPNELRAGLSGREPIEGGDTLYQPANLVGVGEDVFTDDNISTADELAQSLIDWDEGE